MSELRSLLLALLKCTLNRSTSMEELDKTLGYLSDRLSGGLSVLKKEGLVSVVEGQIRMDGDQRAKAAMYAILSGCDPEIVARALDWREFERLSVLALESAGYRTRTRFRFSSSGRRREIDILALSEPRILCLDCKRWRRSWQRAATVRFVGDQIERVEALCRELPGLAKGMGISGWSEARLLPVILTLSDTPYRICCQVPVVSVFRLRSFLEELPEYADGLFSRRVPIQCTGSDVLGSDRISTKR